MILRPKDDKKERPKSGSRKKNKARHGPRATVVDIVLTILRGGKVDNFSGELA